jgi:hypothetical protein
MDCSHCGFPIHGSASGLRHYGTHIAHQENECLRLLMADRDRLRAEVEALRADAERWRYINKRNGEWRRFEADGPDPAYSMLCVRLPYDADLSCRATREIAIDAARAAQGERG